MTHEQYLEKLKLLNIKTYPMEKYINSKTSILHKCTCGADRKVTPTILCKNGDTCRKCMNESKNTHEEYIKKLKIKGIKTIPIEKYLGAKIKIKHKCVCGNIRNISPEQLNRTGDKCKNCMNDNKLLTKNYINNLKRKGITIKLMGEYKGLHTKTEHLCDCGNIWKVEPSSILHKNTKCGCIKKSNKIKIDRKFYKDKPTVLYYIKLNNIYKIGITLFNKSIEQSINRRYSKSHKDSKVKLEIIDYKLYKDGEIAYLNEQEIIEMYKEEKYVGENFIKTDKKSGGESECFVKDIYDDIKYYFL
jgi:hypothetical protein